MSTAATVLVARAAAPAAARQIFRNGVLVGECRRVVADWCGARGRRETYWVVQGATGHVYRAETLTLAAVRALFA